MAFERFAFDDDHRRPKIVAEQTRGFARGQSVSIPYFYGNLSSIEFLDWLSKVDDYLDEIEKSEQVRIVVHKLRGEAAT